MSQDMLMFIVWKRCEEVAAAANRAKLKEITLLGILRSNLEVEGFDTLKLEHYEPLRKEVEQRLIKLVGEPTEQQKQGCFYG